MELTCSSTNTRPSHSANSPKPRLRVNLPCDVLLAQDLDRGNALSWRAGEPVAQVGRRCLERGADEHFVHALIVADAAVPAYCGGNPILSRVNRRTGATSKPSNARLCSPTWNTAGRSTRLPAR